MRTPVPVRRRCGPPGHCDQDEPRPAVDCFVAREGERVEFLVFGIGNDFHTLHLHGHTWVDNRHGVLAPTAALHAGARFRGAGSLPADSPPGPRTLGYYCSIPVLSRAGPPGGPTA